MSEFTQEEIQILRNLVDQKNLRISGTVEQCLKLAEIYAGIAKKLDAALKAAATT